MMRFSLKSNWVLVLYLISSSQSYGFSSSHVWMWELDYKESWAAKNWCSWTVVLEKTLESPLDCKEIQSVHPKGSEVTQSCPTLCNPMECSLPGSSFHGFFQAIVLEWIAISFSRGSSQARDRTRVSHIVDRCFTVWATREVKSILNTHWKDWCWSWNSNTLATWCDELIHLKRPWCWEKLKAGGEWDDRGWDGWMASPSQWTWVWVNSRSWWWTGRPGMLQSMESQIVRNN